MKYPSQIEGSGSDFVRFTHRKYRNNRNQDGGQRIAPEESGSTITLYMPNSTPPVQNAQNWGRASFSGPLGRAKSELGIAASNIVNDPSNNFSSIDKAKASFENIGEKVGGAVRDVASQGIPALQQGVTELVAGYSGFDGANQLLAMSRGQIYNPNVELLYRGTQFREFTFSYTFVPKSEDEATAVNQIIKEFKEWSAPELNGQMFEVPDVWQVTYINGTNGEQHQFMNEFKPAALMGVSVAHNPGLDMHATFDNGMPIVTSMVLSFQEVDIITRQDHRDSASRIGY